MAVCNLFKTLENNTGNFLLFSQYTEDLTQSSTHPDIYRVVPSRFVVMDVDYSIYNNFTFPKLIQDRFENGCAFLKEQPDVQWTPEVSRNLFWNTLFENNIILTAEKEVEGKTISYCPQVKCVCDINIYTYDKYNEMGYNEIYCYIPTDAPATYAEVVENKVTKFYNYESPYVVGYNEKDTFNVSSCDIKISQPLSYTPESRYNFTFEDGIQQRPIKELDSFKFNTLVVLYDVYVMDNNTNELVVKYKNIPMGIHLCGLISEKTTTNENTKFITNPDIYGAGTSYGLRICSRFTATPNSDNIKTIDIMTENDGGFAANSIAMAEMAKTMQTMNKVITDIYNQSQASKEMLAIYKNNKTNVPYIKYINKKPYWFVNGHNTGVCAIFYHEVDNYTDEEMQTGVDNFEAALGY